MKNLFVLAAVSAAVLVACGDENTTNVNESTGLEVIAKGEKLAKCTDEIEGKMVYVTDSSAVYYCIDGEWTDLNGADGDDGADGKSAYQIAGDSGYTGTEAEWLESLKGSCNCSSEAVSKESSSSEESSSNVESSSSGESSESKESSSSKEESSSSIAVVDPSDVVTGTMTDARDGKTYKTVTIGTQTWMAENLNYAYLQKTATLDSSSFCTEDDCDKYGRSYLWSAAVDSAAVFGSAGKGCGNGITCQESETVVRGVCPEKWHLPSESEWNVLITAVGGASTAGTKLRSKSTDDWMEEYVGTDDYGFSVVAAGMCDWGSSYYCTDYNLYAGFWTSTEMGVGNAYYWFFIGSQESARHESYDDYTFKRIAFSVRCVKDSE